MVFELRQCVDCQTGQYVPRKGDQDFQRNQRDVGVHRGIRDILGDPEVH
mgnify:CR=1 FL=1